MVIWINSKCQRHNEKFAILWVINVPLRCHRFYILLFHNISPEACEFWRKNFSFTEKGCKLLEFWNSHWKTRKADPMRAIISKTDTENNRRIPFLQAFISLASFVYLFPVHLLSIIYISRLTSDWTELVISVAVSVKISFRRAWG